MRLEERGQRSCGWDPVIVRGRFVPPLASSLRPSAPRCGHRRGRTGAQPVSIGAETRTCAPRVPDLPGGRAASRRRGRPGRPQSSILAPASPPSLSSPILRIPSAFRVQGGEPRVCECVCVCVCVCVAAHLGRANVTVCGGGMLAQGGALGYLLLLLFPRGGRGRTGTSDLCPIPHPPARPTAWMRATSSEDTRALTPATHPSQLGEERQPTSDGWCAPSSLCPLTAGLEAAGWMLPDVGVQFSTTGSGCFQGYWRVFRLPGSQGATKSNIQISLISWTWRVQ